MALHARRRVHQGIRVSHPATMMTSSPVFGDDAVKTSVGYNICGRTTVLPPPNRALILIPTYNEVKNVGRMIDSIALSGIEADVLIIDDYSPDGTAQAVECLSAQLLNFSAGSRGRGGPSG
jgi:cellulose synthase/poly-beta-1,6-N-acetylglucosamine synthase-like glycosyltransferase